MSGFKLLAIRPIKGCDVNFRKRLKDGLVYKFFQDYKFVDDKGHEISIKQNNLKSKIIKINSPEEELDLYSDNDLRINISAVVGENGSGKSSLIELFFLAIFLKSVKSNMLNISKEIKETRASTTKIDENIQRLENRVMSLQGKNENNEREFREIVIKIDAFRKKRERLNHHVESLVEANNFSKSNKIYLEIYFEIGKEIQKISIYPKGYKNKAKIDEFVLTKDTITEFFYTISLNYSLYGLNALDMGKWVERLFHKNDGYLTPVVINPMRTNGNININTENYLAQNRILVNLIDKRLHQIQIIDGKEIDSIQFKLPTKKLEQYNYFFKPTQPSIDVFHPKSTVFQMIKSKEKSSPFDQKITKDILSFFDIDNDFSIALNGIDAEPIRKYISQKLFKIARTYSEYNIYFQFDTSGKEIINDFDNFIKKIRNDYSHKTLKLRQLTNVLKYGILANIDSLDLKVRYGITHPGVSWSEGKFKLNFNQYAKIITHAYNTALKENKESRKPELIEFIPNAYFEPKVSFKNEGGFQALSSGEQQYFNALNTIIYHVLNLDSIKDHYNKVNVIFDEIELYFHPEFQRIFISDLLKTLKKLRLENIKEMNFIFSTHSPFILSDIPSNNVLRLQNGKPAPTKVESNTFGANIHDLLANDFFLENGFMGEFAKEKIKDLINFLNNDETKFKWDDKQAKQVINVIGEPYLKSDLLDLYNSKIFNNIEEIDLEIKRLQKIKAQIN